MGTSLRDFALCLGTGVGIEGLTNMQDSDSPTPIRESKKGRNVKINADGYVSPFANCNMNLLPPNSNTHECTHHNSIYPNLKHNSRRILDIRQVKR